MLATKLRSFEEAFDLLNARFFENALSKSVITIYPTPGAYGHFTPWKSWEGAGGAGYCEINLGAATVNRPVIESIATLVHEMTHQWCYERGVKDTSRGGTYHNKRFKAEAERRGLLIGYLDNFSARVPNREHLTNTGASTYSPSAFLRFSLTATVNPATARPLAVARISTSRVR